MTTMSSNMLRSREAFRAALSHTRDYARRHPRVTLLLALLLLVLVLTLMKVIGLGQILTALATAVAILVGYALYQVMVSYRQAKPFELPETSAKKDVADPVGAMKIGLERAISSLKDSMSGEGALSALPWYMLIGPPGSGKTTALKNSGLQASYPKDSKEPDRSGATRTCDWWVTNEGFFLDTAGRYIEQEEDRREWLALLGMVKEQGRRVPLHGVLIMVSLPDLLRADDNQIELLAENLRARLKELVEELGVVFPVYLVFTKCDLLRGFVEFFENVNTVDREEQVWGYTFPAPIPPGMTPSDQFEAAFGKMVQALQIRRHTRLLSLLGSKKLQDVFSFPLQLSQAKQSLSHFVDQLFQSAGHPDSALFRGFYLTSATQKGHPLDQVINSVNHRAGLAESTGIQPGEPKEKGPYFIKQFFAGLVLPDQNLARLSSAAKRRRMFRVRMATVGAAAVGAACVAAAVYSYSVNRELGRQIQESAENSFQAIITEPKTFIDHVQDKNFNRFRQLVQVLQEGSEDGPPLKRRWGMNREANIHESARDLYVRLFDRLYAMETRTQLEAALGGFVENPSKIPAGRDSDFYYSLLKTYLMLSPITDGKEPILRDQSFLAEWLKQIWHDTLPAKYGEKATPDVVKAVDQQIETYSRVLSESQGLFHRDGDLVKKTRAALQSLSYPKRVYARVQREMIKEYKPEPVTLASLLKGQNATLLENSKEIPGYFTPKFDSGLFAKTNNRVLDQADRDSWVLDVPQGHVEDAVQDLYREDYINRWFDFLSSIKMRPAKETTVAIQRLEDVTKDNAELVALLEAVDKNTSFSQLSNIVSDVSKCRIPRSASSHPVAEAFNSFHQFVVPCAEGAGLKKYRLELQNVRNALVRRGEPQAVSDLSKARNEVEVLIQNFDPRTQKAIGKLLREPIIIIPPPPPCPEDSYPFKRNTKQEITITNFSELFRPETGRLLEFYKSIVSPVALEKDEGYRQVEAIAEAFFLSPSPDPDVKFEMTPEAIGGVAVSDIRLMIDGQELDYRNGDPEFPKPFQWPGRSDSGGALLQVVVDGKSYDKRFDGRWGLFRMLEEGHAKVNRKDPSELRLAWTIGIGATKPVVVGFKLKAERSKHPFAPRFFENFHCPNGDVGAVREGR